ncbi:MAG TPA: 16S rRNA (guanine(966)-N(2))-methyltransferase RsmD [Burkholderiaceae bacterium]|nr:16S rRNA (guanine(966)-N(2))-methyltransferase RsmD [Burkholderiaceae bacterium]
MTRPAERRGAGGAGRPGGPAPRGPASRGAASRGAASRGAAPAKVRIIGGDWKRTPLAVVDAPGLRPTPDRVRETLFNWLGQRLDGWRCLDLYAGTGALGLEAASRGAAKVVLVEREPRAVQALRDAQARLKADRVEIVQADATAWLGSARDRFDLVFLDPPFGGDALGRVLPRVVERVEPGGFVYVESDRALAPDAAPLAALPGVELRRADKAGQVHYHLLHLPPRPPGA